MIKVQTSSLAICLILAVLAGCGGKNDNSEKPGGDGDKTETTAPAANDNGTTASAATVSAGQLDFFTERYISADERLLRRQNRIEEELRQTNAAGQS